MVPIVGLSTKCVARIHHLRIKCFLVGLSTKYFVRIRQPVMFAWFLVGLSTKCFARIRHPRRWMVLSRVVHEAFRKVPAPWNGWMVPSRVFHKMFREDSPP